MHLETLNKRCWAKTVLKPKFTFFLDFKKRKGRSYSSFGFKLFLNM